MTMNKNTNPPSLLALFVVVLFTYFGQVHPYIHFHHSHEDVAWPFELSLHPVDMEPEHIPEHHDDDHHHDYQQYVESGLPLRQQITTIDFPAEFVSVVVWSLGENPIQTSRTLLDDFEPQWRLFDLRSTASLRSPPVCA